MTSTVAEHCWKYLLVSLSMNFGLYVSRSELPDHGFCMFQLSRCSQTVFPRGWSNIYTHFQSVRVLVAPHCPMVFIVNSSPWYRQACFCVENCYTIIYLFIYLFLPKEENVASGRCTEFILWFYLSQVGGARLSINWADLSVVLHSES